MIFFNQVLNVTMFFADLRTVVTPRLKLMLKYSKVELAPPTPQEMILVPRALANHITNLRSGKMLDLTVKVSITSFNLM